MQSQRSLAARMERIERVMHIGSWQWTPRSNTFHWSDEMYRMFGLVPGTEISLERVFTATHPDDRAGARRRIERALETGEPFQTTDRIILPSGEVREIHTIGEVVHHGHSKRMMLIGTTQDITDRARFMRALSGERQILEALATAAPLVEMLGRIVKFIEANAPRALASILLLDASGSALRHRVAPSLPPQYVLATESVPVAPSSASCGTAVYRGEPVYVSDIANDSLWADWKHHALPHGLRACWSVPVFSRDGRALGALEVYYREPRDPTPTERDLVSRAVHLTSITVESRQFEAQLRALSARLESIREDERTGIAREIHDQLGQSLTALKLDAAHLSRRAADKEPVDATTVRTMADEMAATIDGLIDMVRRIAAELRPGLLDDLGLHAAIEWQAQEFTRRTGLPVTVDSSVGHELIPGPLGTAAFRVFQEALTNVARHAQAKRVQVRLGCERDEVVLEVVDDGVGLPPGAFSDPGSLGLLGMRERAAHHGGTLVVEARAPRGTRVRLQLPLLPFRDMP